MIELMFLLELDKINYTNLKESLITNKKDFVCLVGAFLEESIFTFQSSNLHYCIPLFMLVIYKNFGFKPLIIELCVISAACPKNI